MTDHVTRMMEVALRHHREGNLDLARLGYFQVLAIAPRDLQAVHNLGLVALHQGRAEEAAVRFREALAIHPDFVEAHLNLGKALFDLGRLDEATRHFQRANVLDPDCATALFNLASVHRRHGRTEAAIACLRRAVSVAPDDAGAHQSLGDLLHAEGRLDEAVEAYRGALPSAPDPADLEARIAGIRFGQGRLTEALVAYQRTLAVRPDAVDLIVNLGNVLLAMGAADKAVVCCLKAVSLAPDSVAAHLHLGRALLARRDFGAAATALARANALAPETGLSELTHARRQICDWSGFADEEELLSGAVARGNPEISPFVMLSSTSSPATLLQCARQWRKLSLAARPVPRPGGGRIRLGYLSSDFHTHPVAHLAVELLERHDRVRFEVFGYSYGPDDGSQIRQRIARAVDHFRDIRTLSHEQAARLIGDDGIDILVDLKGYTGITRCEILALRPAPVQVNFLGFPGTLGNGLADYVIADPVVVPMADQPFFSERIVHLPHCYQPNDSRRPIDERTPTRQEAGLPEQGFVFCCFNSGYKIIPPLFDVWMRLLAAVPGSVLWLFEGNPEMTGNLRREASARGVAPERLVFAPKVPMPQHLARQRLADLFLDTLPYNAHTTGSDALWAGLPMITCLGESFPGRVGASLLRAAGLDELVTRSLAEYEALALALARSPERLAGLRRRLEDGRGNAPLWDTAGYARHIEAAYVRMAEACRAGEAPVAFAVTPDGGAAPATVPQGDRLLELLRPARLTAVLDVGANPIDGEPPYRPMLAAGLCTVTGFEPQEEALRRLEAARGPHERYFPDALGAGAASRLHVCRAPGMTSMLEPDPASLALFNLFDRFGEVIRTVEIPTRRLDDVPGIGPVDFLKIDVQGSELTILAGGTETLHDAVAIQIEVSFLPLYREQPVLWEVDRALRERGFVPHCLAALKRWPLAPMVVDGNPRKALNQLLEADMVYVRDFRRPELLSTEQWKHLALIAHHCYGSADLAFLAVRALVALGELAPAAANEYLEIVRAGIAQDDAGQSRSGPPANPVT